MNLKVGEVYEFKWFGVSFLGRFKGIYASTGYRVFVDVENPEKAIKMGILGQIFESRTKREQCCWIIPIVTEQNIVGLEIDRWAKEHISKAITGRAKESTKTITLTIAIGMMRKMGLSRERANPIINRIENSISEYVSNQKAIWETASELALSQLPFD